VFPTLLSIVVGAAPVWAQEEAAPQTEETTQESSPETDSEAPAEDETSTEATDGGEDPQSEPESATETETEAETEAAGEAEPAGKAPAVPATPETEIIEEEDAGAAPASTDTAAETGSTDAEAAGGAEGEEGSRKDSTAALGAGAPVVSQDEGAKPWTVFASVSLNVGSSVLASTEDDAFVTFSFVGTGLYKLANLFDGRVDAIAQVSGTQVLDPTVRQGVLTGTSERQFFLNDVILGALGRSLINESNTGLLFGYNTLFRLPTSPFAQAVDRVLRWDNSINVTRLFPNVGPGNVILVLSGTFRKDFAPNNPSFDEDERASIVANGVCSNQASRSDGTCASDQGSIDYGLIGSFRFRYLSNAHLNFSLGYALFYNVFSDLTNGSLDEDLNALPGVPASEVVGNSVNSVDGGGASLLSSTTLTLQYVFNANLSASAGMSTFQNFFTRVDGQNQAANPFLLDPVNNSTSFFLTVAGNY
jgi:hypothetical protein